MASSMDGVMDNQLRVAVMTMRCTTPDSATWGFGNGLNTEMHGIRRPCPRNSIGSRQDVDTTSDEISRTMMPKTSRWTDGIISPRGLRDHVLVVMATARTIQGGRGQGAVLHEWKDSGYEHVANEQDTS